MGLFRFFGRKENQENQEIFAIDEFCKMFNELLDQQKYIAKSCYLNQYNEIADQYNSVQKMLDDQVLKSWCKKHKIDYKKLLKNLQIIKNKEILVDKHNSYYLKTALLENKNYFDHILDDVDPNIKLDEEQRKAILDDEDYSLIIAGAGSGKTTTVAAKVKFLVDKLHINPQDILIIAFTNKAVDELKDRIQKKLKLNVPISTFHSCGRAIVKKDIEYADSSVERDNFFFIHKYLTNLLLNDNNLLSKVIMFFAYYLYFTPDIQDKISLEDHFSLLETNDFFTLKHDLEQTINDMAKNKITIKNEQLRSIEEVQIANFLYLNSIEYEYEAIYPYPIPNSNKLYTPDFKIKQGNLVSYIEHFGITEDGKNSRYTQEELTKYKKNMNDKINHHKNNATKLIVSYSVYNDKRSLIEHLKEKLIAAGFILTPRSNEDIYQKLVDDQNNKYFFKLSRICSRFINLFKANDFNENQFSIWRKQTQNQRTLLFFDIIEQVYLAYQLYLKENKKVDFEDMINESTRLLKEVKSVKEKIQFKYILIDEFQDISRARMNLVNEIHEVTNAKICAVGDDWQSIYGYAGAGIDLFTNFEKNMGYASVLKITNTYRNAQELIDIAGNFIQKNSSQIKKKLHSNKNIEKPITIYTYDGSYKSKDNQGANVNEAQLLEKVIKKIVELDGENTRILIIGRYNFDGNKLIQTGLFEIKSKNTSVITSVKYPKIKLDFMTAHSTKGLTYDNVIIINAINAKYGFPAQIDDDPIFNYVRKIDKSYEYAEERRLFYVAMTRTKNRVFILTPNNNPSTFILELINDYPKQINLHEEKWKLNKDSSPIKAKRTSCPICGYPLQLRENANYGLKLYMCTNEPEICDYLTNNLKSGKMPIHLCKKCGNGTMIVKPMKNKSGYIFGCSNYNTIGCDNVEHIN